MPSILVPEKPKLYNAKSFFIKNHIFLAQQGCAATFFAYQIEVINASVYFYKFV